MLPHSADQEPTTHVRGGNRPSEHGPGTTRSTSHPLILQSVVHSFRATSRRTVPSSSVAGGPDGLRNPSRRNRIADGAGHALPVFIGTSDVLYFLSNGNGAASGGTAVSNVRRLSSSGVPSTTIRPRSSAAIRATSRRTACGYRRCSSAASVMVRKRDVAGLPSRKRFYRFASNQRAARPALAGSSAARTSQRGTRPLKARTRCAGRCQPTQAGCRPVPRPGCFKVRPSTRVPPGSSDLPALCRRSSSAANFSLRDPSRK
jgi:hypothetical protein